MIVVTVELQVREKHLDDYRRAIARHAENSLSREPGCRRFDVSAHREDGTRMFLYELYDDASALEAHVASDHLRDFDELTSDWIQHKTIQVWEWTPETTARGD